MDKLQKFDIMMRKDGSNPVATAGAFWENTYRQNIAKMIGVGYRYTADRQIAEDLAQDAFMIACEKIETYKGKGPFEAWLRRIMVNECLQYLREQNKKKHLNTWLRNEAITVETDEENINHGVSEITETELLEAISRLPEHHKLVFNLYVLDQFTHAQIGKELGISEGTSKSHLARARKKLKDTLNERSSMEKKDRRKRAFALFFWNIDGLYKKRLKDFGLTSRKDFSFDFLHSQYASVKTISHSVPIFKKLPGIGIAASLAVITIVLLLVLTKTKHKEAILAKVQSPEMAQGDSATTLKKDIVLHENKIVNKKTEDMKNLKTMGAAVLIAGASLVMPVNAQTPVKVTNRIAAHAVTKTVDSFANRNVKDNMDVTGNFYSDRLYWSPENNELYFEGKSIIAFGENNFVNEGTVSFLGKVYYLVIDGKRVKWEGNSTKRIKLAEKQYNLTRLLPESAVKKYGEEGRNGAIEIAAVP